VTPVYIWVRTTLDWADEEAVLAGVRPGFRPRIDLWNRTFNLPFHVFRHRVREIARLNHARVEGAVCADWDEIPRGALVLPVDDDDWFSPDAARVLDRARDPDAAGYVWEGRWLEVPMSLGHRVYLLRRRLLPWSAPKWICSTNTYALPKEEWATPLLGNHVDASRYFEGRAGSLKRLPGGLSVANRTLASQTALRRDLPTLSRGALIAKFRRYKQIYDRPTPAELAWCRPYKEAMAELMAALELAE
jgi:hypothetical protein